LVSILLFQSLLLLSISLLLLLAISGGSSVNFVSAATSSKRYE
jgi:hypothetical protein